MKHRKGCMLQLKTKAAVLTSLLLVSALIILVNIRPALSNPATLLVPSQYSTIQAALAVAGPGDTIRVAADHVANENSLVITQNGLTLQGENKDTTIIDGGNSGNRVIIVEADNVVISGFTIRNAGTSYGAFGTFLNYSKNAYLTNNIFSGCSFLVRADHCTNVTVTSSTFLDGTFSQGAAMYAIHCQTGLIESNTFNGNYVGAFVVFSTGFIIRNNSFSSCIYHGATISHSAGNWVVKNTFTFNDASIVIKYSESVDNTVIGNTVSNSNEGLSLQYTVSNNIIHHNNFINNVQQVNFTDSLLSNVWSTSLPIAEGNYWSNYAGIDANKDGIGDSAYNVGTGNQDPYPLIGRFTEFSVANQTGTYNVYAISNSLIQNFGFDQAAKKIDFSVSGTSGTTGICRVVFPKGLVLSPYTVFVNGVNQTYGSAGNSTHIALYFSYVHGNQASSIVIIPEFPAMLILPLLMLLTLLIAALKRKKYSG